LKDRAVENKERKHLSFNEKMDLVTWVKENKDRSDVTGRAFERIAAIASKELGVQVSGKSLRYLCAQAKIEVNTERRGGNGKSQDTQRILARQLVAMALQLGIAIDPRVNEIAER
jgi:hypothetical protein